MAYRDDIIALSPDHLWRFDADLLDSVGTLDATGVSFGVAGGAAITEDAANSSGPTTTDGRATLATAATVDQALSRKCIGGWVRIDSIQPPPKSLYREGATGVNQLCFVCWAGNNLMLDIVNGGTVYQLFADQPLSPNRTYHILALFSGTGFDDSLELYVDGVLQGNSSPGLASLGARTAGAWGDPSGGTEVGRQPVLLNAAATCRYAFWASWGDTALPTSTEIREELFEKGALPGITISAGTQVAMQTALDGFSSTVRPDEPLNIRVEEVTGGGDLTLTADNITHDPLASIHVQYMGTGTLNWVKENGSDASIGSTPNGGTINFVEAVNVTVTALDANTGAPIQDARVLLEAAAGGPLTPGTSILTGLTNASGEVTGSFQFSSNQPVTGRVRKGTSSPLYKTGAVGGTITANGFDGVVPMVPDE